MTLILLITNTVDIGEEVGLGLILFTSVFSAITLYLIKSESWIGLYLKRRAMEEKQKIEGLKKS